MQKYNPPKHLIESQDPPQPYPQLVVLQKQLQELFSAWKTSSSYQELSGISDKINDLLTSAIVKRAPIVNAVTLTIEPKAYQGDNHTYEDIEMRLKRHPEVGQRINDTQIRIIKNLPYAHNSNLDNGYCDLISVYAGSPKELGSLSLDLGTSNGMARSFVTRLSRSQMKDIGFSFGYEFTPVLFEDREAGVIAQRAPSATEHYLRYSGFFFVLGEEDKIPDGPLADEIRILRKNIIHPYFVETIDERLSGFAAITGEKPARLFEFRGVKIPGEYCNTDIALNTRLAFAILQHGLANTSSYGGNAIIERLHEHNLKLLSK